MLGLKVPRDSEGCLQDIHWSLGDMGYFPTYTLGNLNAAQLMHRARQEQPGLQADLERGQYSSLLAWLRAKVHCHGQRFLPQDLMKEATGEQTRSVYHLEYLQKKFAGR
jgi:carboxypeptidase Taq